MAATLVQNITLSPVPLPSPYVGILPPLGQVFLPGDINTVLANLGGATKVQGIFALSFQPLATGDSSYGPFGASQTLTDAATVVVDASKGQYMTLATTAAVGATRKIGNPTNTGVGTIYYLEITADAASRDVTWDTNYVFDNGVKQHLGGASAEVDLFSFYRTSAGKFVVQYVGQNAS
jgi:hypothetical protein